MSHEAMGSPQAVGAEETAPPLETTIEHLLSENATLKAKLRLSEQQRVIEDVVKEQVSRFLSDASHNLRTSEAALTCEEETARPSDEKDPGAAPPMHAAIATALSQLCEDKKKLEEALLTLQTDTVRPLNERVDQLQQENSQLQEKVLELEMAMGAAPAPPLVTELRLLRESEGLLREQLRDTQTKSIAAVEKVAKMMRDGAAATAALPEYIHAVAELKDVLRESHTTQKVLELAMEERQKRFSVEEELRVAHAEGLQALAEERVAAGLRQLAEAKAREEVLEAEKEDILTQLTECQRRVEDLQREGSETENALAAKRQRVEQDVLDNPSSVRGEYIRFWYDGHSTITRLQQRVVELEKKESALKQLQGHVKQQERARQSMTSQLVAVASEVERAREEIQRLRAQYAGLEVERDQLSASLAMTLHGEMGEAELQNCCRMIREGAERAAAASAAVVADPQALQQAMRRAQELKNEVAQLQRQKDKLLRYVQLREERVSSLLEREALRHSGGPGDSSTSSDTHVPLPQLLEYARQCANDVFAANETAALEVVKGRPGTEDATKAGGSSVTPTRDSFVHVQTRLLESQEKLLASQRRLHETTLERNRLLSELEQSTKEHNSATESRDATIASLEASNAALIRRSSIQAQEEKQLKAHYAVSVAFAEQAITGLRFALDTLRAEKDQVEGLRQLVEKERKDIGDILRREARSNWSGNSEDGMAKTVQSVVDALGRVSSFIQETAATVSLECESERTAYVAKLSKAIQEQEQRVLSLQCSFEEASKQQAVSLAERITAAQSHWESEWRQKFQAVEEERTQLSLQQFAHTALFSALERAAVPPRPTVPSTPASAMEVRSQASTAEVLRAIDSFVQSARTRLAAPPVPVANEEAADTTAAVHSNNEEHDDPDRQHASVPGESVKVELVAAGSENKEQRAENDTFPDEVDTAEGVTVPAVSGSEETGPPPVAEAETDITERSTLSQEE